MLVALIARDPALFDETAARLHALEHHAVPHRTPGPAAAAVIIRWPIEGPLGAMLLSLSAEPATADAVVILMGDDLPPAALAAARLAGAEIMPAGIDQRTLGDRLRLISRLNGEISRRRALETERTQHRLTRGVLEHPSPFEADGLLLGAVTGRHRARQLLDAGPATCLAIAIDRLDIIRAGLGTASVLAAESAVAAILAAAPARLGDMLYRTEAGAWTLWLSGQDRPSTSALLEQLLSLVEQRRLHPGLADGKTLTISIGIALAARHDLAQTVEERAAAALAHAAGLGGNRARWAR